MTLNPKKYIEKNIIHAQINNMKKKCFIKRCKSECRHCSIIAYLYHMEWDGLLVQQPCHIEVWVLVLVDTPLYLYLSHEKKWSQSWKIYWASTPVRGERFSAQLTLKNTTVLLNLTKVGSTQLFHWLWWYSTSNYFPIVFYIKLQASELYLAGTIRLSLLITPVNVIKNFSIVSY